MGMQSKQIAAPSVLVVLVLAMLVYVYYKGAAAKSGKKATRTAVQPASASIHGSSGELSDTDFKGLVPSADEYLQGVQLLDSAWKIGRNTVSTYNKNASWDLREEPVIPKTLNANNNPFNNSSIVHSQLVDRKFTQEPMPVWKVDSVHAPAPY